MFTNLTAIPQTDFWLFVIVLVMAIVALVIVRRLVHVQTPFFFLGVVGLVLGLWIGNLLGRPLESLPGLYGKYLPGVIQIIVAVATIDLFIAQSASVIDGLQNIARKISQRVLREEGGGAKSPEYILDTSVLIDGRIEGLIRSGFLVGTIIVPRFILQELQLIADAKESMKRAKGRRGLEILSMLQKEPSIQLKILESSQSKANQLVDARLVKFAKSRGAKLVTVDYNLAQVASISGVTVFNLHELANALKPQLLPGETLSVRVVQEGKSRGQGIGFMPDGTMIIVAGGAKHIGEELDVEVERIFQTVSGKMVFVRPVEK